MYKPGDLKLLDPICETWDGYDCDEPDHCHTVYDSNWDHSDGKIKTAPCAYLPHSCDQWVIGGIDEIKQLIIDLTQALIIIEHNIPGSRIK